VRLARGIFQVPPPECGPGALLIGFGAGLSWSLAGAVWPGPLGGVLAGLGSADVLLALGGGDAEGLGLAR
jgi:hypothetical protein